MGISYNLQFFGGRGASGLSGAAGNTLQAHFDKENAKVDEFMNSRKSGSITMDNGQILEKYTMDEMKLVIKEAKDAREMWQDDAIAIRYNNGDIASYVEGDDTSNIKLTGISGVIYNNSNTTAYSGKGVEIVNYKELYPKDYPDSKGYDDDWRMDFTRGRK